MSRRSGNPASRAWQPMRYGGSYDGGMSAYIDPEKRATSYRLTMAPPVRTEVWENDLYNGAVTWFEDGSGHFSFKRNDRTPVRDWRHVQAIKNEIAGPEREAIEIYPPESELVDGANEYHLWVLPEGVTSPIGFGSAGWGDLPDTYDRQSHRQGNLAPGARQRPWQAGLPTGPGLSQETS